MVYELAQFTSNQYGEKEFIIFKKQVIYLL